MGRELRVTFVIFSFAGGGAQRVMSIMANRWVVAGWNVTLLTYDDGRAAPAFGLHASVNYRPLDIACESRNRIEAVGRNMRRLWILRKAIKRSSPEVVISFLDVVNVRTLVATMGLGVPVIVAEHTDPVRRSIGAVWRTLRSWTYGFASCVVTLTPEALGYFSARIQRRGRVIPNPVAVPLEYPDVAADTRRKCVMGMGRLVHVKGFDQLLHAFAPLATKHPEWCAVIWGEGEMRFELECLRDRLGLEGRVRLPGWTTEPFKEMQRASLFVLSSRYEGFSMVLCEAMASGLPVVSFDCPSGPRHIIRQGVDGILVPPNDVGMLSSAMDRLICDRTERERLAVRAVEVVERFNSEKVLRLWEETIEDVLRLRVGSKLAFW